MPSILNNNNNSNFIFDFCIELEKHQYSSDKFFNDSLLKIIENYFGYKNTAITIYDGANYIDAIANNEQVRYLKNIYNRGFYKSDNVAHYTSHNINDSAYYSSSVIRGTDIIDQSYEKSDYYKFLQAANFNYIAVLPLTNFRICIYKSAEESDFSSFELEILNSILKLLKTKFDSINFLNMNTSIKNIHDQYLNNLNTGFIVLDSNFSLINYNKAAAAHFNILFNKNNFSNIYWDLSSIFGNPEDYENNITTKCVNNFKISLASYTEVDCYNFMTKFYYITTEKLDSTKNIQPQLGISNPLSCLSERELEIADALANGLKYQEIADKLFISINTVRTHIKNIYGKLEIDNQRSLIYLYNISKNIR